MEIFVHSPSSYFSLLLLKHGTLKHSVKCCILFSYAQMNRKLYNTVCCVFHMLICVLHRFILFPTQNHHMLYCTSTSCMLHFVSACVFFMSFLRKLHFVILYLCIKSLMMNWIWPMHVSWFIHYKTQTWYLSATNLS